jgi:hypothetical protein
MKEEGVLEQQGLAAFGNLPLHSRSLGFQWLLQQANCHPVGKTLNTPPEIELCPAPFPCLFFCDLCDFTWNHVLQFFMFSKNNITYTVLFCMLYSSSCSAKGNGTYNVLHVVQFFMFCKRNITYNVLHVLLH